MRGLRCTGHASFNPSPQICKPTKFLSRPNIQIDEPTKVLSKHNLDLGLKKKKENPSFCSLLERPTSRIPSLEAWIDSPTISRRALSLGIQINVYFPTVFPLIRLVSFLQFKEFMAVKFMNSPKFVNSILGSVWVEFLSESSLLGVGFHSHGEFLKTEQPLRPGLLSWPCILLLKFRTVENQYIVIC